MVIARSCLEWCRCTMMQGPVKIVCNVLDPVADASLIKVAVILRWCCTPDSRYVKMFWDKQLFLKTLFLLYKNAKLLVCLTLTLQMTFFPLLKVPTICNLWNSRIVSSRWTSAVSWFHRHIINSNISSRAISYCAIKYQLKSQLKFDGCQCKNSWHRNNHLDVRNRRGLFKLYFVIGPLHNVHYLHCQNIYISQF